MQVKAADIARAMGISKATVSLALNGKGGVSEQTRQQVFLCREALERGDTWRPAGPLAQEAGEKAGRAPARLSGKEVKLVRLHRGRKGEPDFEWEIHEALERGFREKGYALGMTFLDMREDSRGLLREQCNQESVAGVLVLGEELLAGEEGILKEIQKPLLLYDGTLQDGVSCVLADEGQGMELGVGRLFEADVKNILYLGSSKESLSALRRKKGFLEAMARRGVKAPLLKRMGVTAEQAYVEMGRVLREESLPEGMIFECPFVALGCIRALLEKGICFPQEVSLISMDQLPSYMTGGKLVTSILRPHEQQAYWATQLLLREMEAPGKGTGRLFLNCTLKEGETVRGFLG